MNKAKQHILLVDDDPVTRQLIASILAEAGFEVIHAKDGSVGREIARRFHPDLILLDIDMPVMDGIETATRLKSEAETSDIPIILLSNMDLSIEAQKWANELGLDGYVPKATGSDDLVAKIKTVLINNVHNDERRS